MTPDEGWFTLLCYRQWSFFNTADHWTGERINPFVVPIMNTVGSIGDCPQLFVWWALHSGTVDKTIGQGRWGFDRNWIHSFNDGLLVTRHVRWLSPPQFRQIIDVPLSHILRVSTCSFKCVWFDALGSNLKATPRGNQYLFLIHVHYTSRHADIYPMENMDMETTTKILWTFGLEWVFL